MSPATFLYQTTDPATNHLVGMANTPVDIPAGGSQSFLFVFTPTAMSESKDITLAFTCAGLPPAPTSAVNMFSLRTRSPGLAADVIPVISTPTGDGILAVPSNGVTSFSVAAIDIGDDAESTIYVNAVTSAPVDLTICQTDKTTGACLAPALPATPGISYTAARNDVVTFSVFVTSRSRCR